VTSVGSTGSAKTSFLSNLICVRVGEQAEREREKREEREKERKSKVERVSAHDRAFLPVSLLLHVHQSLAQQSHQRIENDTEIFVLDLASLQLLLFPLSYQFGEDTNFFEVCS
jgi:hypothetical protein